MYQGGALAKQVGRVAHSDSKGKGLPQQAEVAQGVPCRLRHRIFLAFSTTGVVGR